MKYVSLVLAAQQGEAQKRLERRLRRKPANAVLDRLIIRNSVRSADQHVLRSFARLPAEGWGNHLRSTRTLITKRSSDMLRTIERFKFRVPPLIVDAGK
jgi:hypothetical protein